MSIYYDPAKREERLVNPSPGDYWNEMMHPVLVVIARNKRGVLVIEETIDVGAGWNWNYDKAHTITIDELREKVKHVTCYHQFHLNAVNWYKEHLGIV